MKPLRFLRGSRGTGGRWTLDKTLSWQEISFSHLEEGNEKDVSDGAGDSHPEVLNDHDEVVLRAHDALVYGGVVPVEEIQVIEIDHFLVLVQSLGWVHLTGGYYIVECPGDWQYLSLCAPLRSYFARRPLGFHQPK